MVSKSSKSVDVGMPSKISFWKGLNRCIILSFEIKLWASIISADILIFERTLVSCSLVSFITIIQQLLCQKLNNPLIGLYY